MVIRTLFAEVFASVLSGAETGIPILIALQLEARVYSTGVRIQWPKPTSAGVIERERLTDVAVPRKDNLSGVLRVFYVVHNVGALPRSTLGHGREFDGAGGRHGCRRLTKDVCYAKSK